MNVIALTVFIGLALVSFFIFLFLHQSTSRHGASSGRDALLPFLDEKNTPAKRRGSRPKSSMTQHEQQ